MEILNTKIDWMYKDIDADPIIHILVDKIPREFVYHKKGNLYWAENDGYVSYFIANTGNNININIKLDDGSLGMISGIECPKENIMIRNGIHCIRVGMTDSEKVFGEVLSSGFAAVTIAKIRGKMPEGHELMLEGDRYFPAKCNVKRRCMRCKGSGRCDKALHWSDPLKLVLCPECSGRGSVY